MVRWPDPPSGFEINVLLKITFTPVVLIEEGNCESVLFLVPRDGWSEILGVKRAETGREGARREIKTKFLMGVKWEI